MFSGECTWELGNWQWFQGWGGCAFREGGQQNNSCETEVEEYTTEAEVLAGSEVIKMWTGGSSRRLNHSSVIGETTGKLNKVKNRRRRDFKKTMRYEIMGELWALQG